MGNAKVAVFDAGTAYFLDSVITCASGGVLEEFLGGDVPLGPWDP